MAKQLKISVEISVPRYSFNNFMISKCQRIKGSELASEIELQLTALLSVAINVISIVEPGGDFPIRGFHHALIGFVLDDFISVRLA